MSERLSLVVEDGVGALLTQLAGGERRRGQYVSDLVRGRLMVGDDAVAHMEARLAGIEQRVEAAERQLTAVIARLYAAEP